MGRICFHYPDSAEFGKKKSRIEQKFCNDTQRSDHLLKTIHWKNVLCHLTYFLKKHDFLIFVLHINQIYFENSAQIIVVHKTKEIDVHIPQVKRQNLADLRKMLHLRSILHGIKTRSHSSSVFPSCIINKVRVADLEIDTATMEWPNQLTSQSSCFQAH